MAKLTLASGKSIEIQDPLYEFVKNEAIQNTRWTVDEIFRLLGELVEEFDPKNQELLAKRADRQTKIDEYYTRKREAGWRPTLESAKQDAAELEQFLIDIGVEKNRNYLVYI